jgi:uncharacterized protein
MEYNNNYRTEILGTEELEKAQQAFLSKVYAWMFGGLLITGFTAYFISSSELINSVLHGGMLFFLIIVQLVAVISLSAGINKMRKEVAAIVFLGYSFLTGLTLSVIFLVYTAESIQTVFFISAAMFGALSFYGYTTKRKLSGLGSFMFMGLIGLILVSVVNYFIGSSMLYFLISAVGVLVFAGLTAYDTQRLKEMYTLQFQSDELAMKGAIIGALMLYLDFINLFLYLLRFFGSRR